MSSFAGRVSAVAGAFLNTQNQKWRRNFNQCSTLSTLPTPILTSLPTPILTWTLLEPESLQSSSATSCLWRIGLLPDGEPFHVAHFCHPLKSCRFRRRWSSRDSAASREDGDAVVEECTTDIQNYKVRKASVATRSFLFTWSFISVITTIVSCGLHWVDGMCTRGQEYIKPRMERLKIQCEPVKYWAFISCVLFLWLALAFFLHWQIQRWETCTMVLAHPSDNAFDPGGSVCHSLWPNAGLGCQLSFT